MTTTTRPATPPQPTRLDQPTITPEQVRRREEQRLKAKALREQHDAASTSLAAGQKRSAPFDGTRASEKTLRDARHSQPPGTAPEKPLDTIEPAHKFARNKYIEYDFSAMTDTKGGFLTSEDDPFNKALHAPLAEEKPASMTQREWERQQLDKKMRAARTGPYEPNIASLQPKDGCAECGSFEVDWRWVDVFGVRVCGGCKEEKAEKYSLLTKSEAKEDYLLTEPELKDEELLPRLEKPNPHKSTWQPMLLFLRCQVEEYAFSEKKWGSGERLDEEFERRQGDKKKRREEKFRSTLRDLKKWPRVYAYGWGGKGGNFGDKVTGRLGEKHVHEWGRLVQNEKGESMRRCVDCGMEAEELEF